MRTPRDKSAQRAIPLHERLLAALERCHPESFNPGWIKSHAFTVWRDAPRRPSLKRPGANEIDWSFISSLPDEWANRFTFTVLHGEESRKRAAITRTRYKELSDVIDAISEKAREVPTDRVSPSWIKKNLPTAFDRLREELSLRGKDGKIDWARFKKKLPSDLKKRWHQGLTDEQKADKYRAITKHTPEEIGRRLNEVVAKYRQERDASPTIGLRMVQSCDPALASAIIRRFTLRYGGQSSIDWPECLLHGERELYFLQSKSNVEKVIRTYAQRFIEEYPSLPFCVANLRERYPAFNSWFQITVGNDWHVFKQLLPERLQALWEAPRLRGEEFANWRPEVTWRDPGRVRSLLDCHGVKSVGDLARGGLHDGVAELTEALCQEAWRGNDAAGDALLPLLGTARGQILDKLYRALTEEEKNSVNWARVRAGDDTARIEQNAVLLLIFILSRKSGLIPETTRVFGFILSRSLGMGEERAARALAANNGSH